MDPIRKVALPRFTSSARWTAASLMGLALMACALEPAAVSLTGAAWGQQEPALAASIQKTLDSGYLTLFPDGRFHEEQPVTRAALATVAVKAFDLTRRDPKIAAPRLLRDVPSGYWARNAIDTVVSRDIMAVDAAGRFLPDLPATRAQGFAILAQAYGVYPFTDAEIDETLAPYADRDSLPLWSRKALATAVAEGFINADADSLRAQAPMTRGDLAYALAWWADRQKRLSPAKGL
ncbi:MAG: S-layer homology domain-containing protein [Vampirovibrionales bacterium]|nr:S-layer homology domain-containing protein [Vampirovibrionales bacterium]